MAWIEAVDLQLDPIRHAWAKVQGTVDSASANINVTSARPSVGLLRLSEMLSYIYSTTHQLVATSLRGGWSGCVSGERSTGRDERDNVDAARCPSCGVTLILIGLR